MSTRWRSRICNEEFQNTHCSNRSVSLNLKDYSSWKILTGQLKLCEKVHSCSTLGMKGHLHSESCARSCREIEELRRCCYLEENTEKQRRMEEFLLQHHQESRTVSLFFDDPESPSSYDSAHVPHQALITSSSRKPSRAA